MDAITEHHFKNIAGGKSVENEDGTLSTVRTIIVEIDGVETLIPTVWDGEVVDDETAIKFAKSSGVEWPSRTGDNAVTELEEFDRDIHESMSDGTSAIEAAKILKSESENKYALGGLATANKGITTEEGKNMASKKFQLDKKKADTNNDGRLSKYEEVKGEAIQKAMTDEELVEMYHGGMACEGGIMGYDDISGNPIPLGSSAENVRDDIDAKLSTDEYVLPAHVVKWHGLKHIQMMQSEAEMGLMSMQMDGLIQQVDSEEYEERIPCPECDGSGCEHCEGAGYHEADEDVPSEEMDIEAATVEVDDLLDDEEAYEEEASTTSQLPGMLKKQKFAFIM